MISALVILPVLCVHTGYLAQATTPTVPPQAEQPSEPAENAPTAPENRAGDDDAAPPVDPEQDQPVASDSDVPRAPLEPAFASGEETEAEEEGENTLLPEANPTLAVPADYAGEPANLVPAETPADLMDKHPVDNDANTFKPGTGLSFKSKDERFSMGIRLRVQFRDELQNTHEGGHDTLTNRFGIRRARLQFKGNVFSPNVKYKAGFAFSPNDLGHESDGTSAFTPLLSWYTEFVHLRDLSLRLGQYKLFYSRQRVVSSGDLEFVDRNIAQNEFNLDRDVGGHLFSEDLFGLGLLRYYAGVTIAEGRDVWEAESTQKGVGSYQALARIEVLPFGDFEDYQEVDFTREKRVRLSLGAAYAYLKNGASTRGYRGSAFADGGTADFHNATADLMMKYAGLTLFSDFFWRKGERNNPVASGSESGNLVPNGIGGSVQLGYLLPVIPLGVGARYGAIGRGSFDPDELSLSKEQEVGATVGWYFAQHDIKLQADYFHIWSRGVQTDEGRLQLQVAY